jgi:probable rRNA maturation factor
MSQTTRKAPRLTIRNAQRSIGINPVELEKFARKALALCLQIPKREPTELMRLREISVLFVSDWRMAALHRRFLGKSGPTDVLTFQHGEIVVSAETARRNARRFGNSLGGELRLYLVHGLLHLHGFDDGTKADAKKMEKVQRRILRRAAGLN